LGARLARVQPLIRDLANAHGAASPTATALADQITAEVEAVRRELSAAGGDVDNSQTADE
jgi:hypothetical protein